MQPGRAVAPPGRRPPRTCAASRASWPGLKTARYATGMGLAMRITQWVGCPAADFMYPARW
jgi:hypothetical protein